jgi:MFS family permease
MGFFVSWQFGTGFSWTSHHMNITGRLSSIFFIGLGVGSLASPPLAGWLFQLQPLAVLHLVLAMVLLQVAVAPALSLPQVATVGSMWLVTRGPPCRDLR